jgi:hypothetical protein
MRIWRAAFIVLVIVPIAAHAQIAPVSGIQTSDGTAWAGQTLSNSYSVAAPSQVASWSPPHQSVSASASGQASTVDSDWVSTIGPGSVALSTSVSVSNSQQSLGNEAGWSYSQRFQFTFTLSSPGVYLLSGELWRETHSGWAFSDASTMTFGRQGDPLMLNLLNPSNPAPNVPYIATFGPMYVSLTPGTYTVDAYDHSGWGGAVNSLDSQMTFALTVPGPSAAGILPVLSLLALWRRRPAV